jgi:hypothetical protein
MQLLPPTDCGGPSVRFALKGHGRKTKIKSVHVRAGKLHVSCAITTGGIAVTFSTRSSKPLRTLVGARLQVAVLRRQARRPRRPVELQLPQGLRHG